MRLIIGLLAVLSCFARADIWHSQPESWWIGMHHKSVQVMLHGEQLADMTATVDYPGVMISDVTKTDNPNYLFVTLNIADSAKPGTVQIQLRSEDKTEFSTLTLHERISGSAQRQGFSSADSIYLVAVDRFANGDTKNDVVPGLLDEMPKAHPGGRHGGDLQGLINHLDYIEKMGFSQLWLMPVLINDQPGYSYHGYAATDLYTVDPRYGSNEQYRELSRAAKQRGIGLIKDIILNHIGSEHWWMSDLPAKDWINFNAKFVGTTHRRETLRDPHAAPEDKALFSDGWFVPSMPDLNQRHPLLATYLIQQSIWWIEYAELSGIRLDTYSYPDADFLSEYTQRIMQEYPNFNLVGEEWSVNPAIVAYWQHGSARQDDYQSWLPSLMDFPLQTAVTEALNEPEAWNTGLIKIYQSLSNDFLYANPSALVVFPDNHDMSRVFTQLNDDVRLLKMALAFYATTRGTPQFFYGTEVLMRNPGTDDHGVIRSNFPGGFSGDSSNAFTGEGLSQSQQDVQEYFRQLLSWRKQSIAIEKGHLLHYVPEQGVYVYFRQTEQQTVMVVLNHGEAKKLDLQRFRSGIQSATEATHILTKAKVSLTEPLSLEANSATILEW